MPLTLAQFRARIAARLVDAANAVFATATLDEGLQTALHEYSAALPLTTNTVLVLPGASREIALASLTGLLQVTNVWWPYDSTVENWPPNMVAGWRLDWDDAQPVLMLTARAGLQPQANDELRLWYTKQHTVQNLDSAAVTTVWPLHESGLVTGAAGYALLSERIDQQGAIRLDPNEDQSLSSAAMVLVREFQTWLTTLKTGPGPTGEPYGSGWSMDKWDSRNS